MMTLIYLISYVNLSSFRVFVCRATDGLLRNYQVLNPIRVPKPDLEFLHQPDPGSPQRRDADLQTAFMVPGT